MPIRHVLRRLTPKTHHFTGAAVALCLVALGTQIARVAMAAPPDSVYAPGETLAPTCAPGSSHCSVAPPVATIGSSSVTLGQDDQLSIDASTTPHTYSSAPAFALTYQPLAPGDGDVFSAGQKLTVDSPGLGANTLLSGGLTVLNPHASDDAESHLIGQAITLGSAAGHSTPIGSIVEFSGLIGSEAGPDMSGADGYNAFISMTPSADDTATLQGYVANLSNGGTHALRGMVGYTVTFDGTHSSSSDYAFYANNQGTEAARTGLYLNGAWTTGVEITGSVADGIVLHGNTHASLYGAVDGLIYDVIDNTSHVFRVHGLDAMKIDPNGTFITTGAQADQSYLKINPSEGGSYSIPYTRRRVIMDPSGPLTAITIQLPDITQLVDGQLMGFVTTNAIGTVTLSPGSGTTVQGSGAFPLSEGPGISIIYVGSENKWYPAP